jgi:alkanesulfonate monooxygenase SsuD/methylene tetrahydromethanopterin reductase-like flavin-dependent oxidoreductase (luciferase family)
VAEGHHTERSYDSVDSSDQLSEATMQVGIDSFAAAFEESSRAVGPSDRLRQLVEQIEHADQVGLDAFGIGEHHRREFLDSAPAIILAAAAARTNRIRLTSAVTVLSAADPVRVFQSFATLDLLSQGRAEMIVGRGSSIEAFPLFGLSTGGLRLALRRKT